MRTVALQRITRVTFAVSAGLFLASGLASCVGDNMDNPGGIAGALGVGAFPGAGATGGTNSPTAGSGTTGVGATSFGGTTPNGSGGANAVGGGGAGNSGGASGGMTGAGGTTSQPPCDDVPPKAEPGQPPNENCANAMEYNWCGADWNKGQFCRKTCGDCSTGSGGSGSGGSGSGGSGNGNGGSGGMVVTGPKLPDITGGPEFHASRYWDCCKTHCATNAGAQSCGQDGVSPNGGQSSCEGGSAFACYSEAPRALGSHLSYGYVAKRNANCGACYQIQFTGQGFYSNTDAGSKLIAGKQMIVKVSNAGSDVGDSQFDLMIPGGGVGKFTGGCQRQWGNIDFGVQYGGFFSGDPKALKCNEGDHAQKKACVKALCAQLPAGDPRDGCNWWVDWLQLADNPKFRFKEVQCPNDI